MAASLVTYLLAYSGYHNNCCIMLRKMGEISDLCFNLEKVKTGIKIASQRRAPVYQYREPRLVAVTKTKPTAMIVAAYQQGLRHFAENYIQELVTKANDEVFVVQKLQTQCPDIRWHFIGHLQRNKVTKLVSVPNLYLLETVDSIKLATALNEALKKDANRTGPLMVFVQVNTSEEEAKGGCQPEQLSSVVKHILNECPTMVFKGLMTIGQFGYNPEDGPNPDFVKLVQCRSDLCQELKLNSEDVELSMGMSDDYEHAIVLGSTNVRVGTLLFGKRTLMPN
ncbi:hypothetical protein B566_EDAN007828 [Ephemera danica]|nr:hypothetical protein B566_EDAN007828 [Ephemera danica]